MQFYQIIRNILNFCSLSFFLFFISCVAMAQEPLSQIINSELNKINNEKIITNDSTLKTKETEVESNKKIAVSKKINSKTNKNIVKKKSKKTPKKVKRIIRKKIIKKVYINKEEPTDSIGIETEKSTNILEEQNEPAEFIKKNNLIKSYNIDNDFLLEIEIKENCEKIFGESCFRSDKFFQEPYFHYTIISIFQKKIIAEQYFEGGEFDKKFLKIEDGEYFFTTKNNNKILAVIRNGLVNQLILVDGNIESENKINSKCQYADKLLAFYRLNKPNEITENSVFFLDKKNYKGLVEATIYYEKIDPQTFYSTIKIPNKEIKIIQEINLCKKNDKIEAIERDFTKSECSKKFLCTMQTLETYGSDGISTREQNYSYDDFYKFDQQINLEPNQLGGLIDEVNKLSAEDKKDLKKRCFNDKNIDLINCSISEQCEDYLSVSGCEVEYYFDSDKK